MSPDRKPSVLLIWLMPAVVILSLVIVFFASRAPGKPPTETTDEKTPAADQTSPASLFIEDIGPPHDTAAQGFPASTCQPCHTPQYDDWKGSPHAHATQHAGYLAALKHMAASTGTGTLSRCVICHAPQVGQYEGLAADGTISEGSQTAEGITCSACHKKDTPVGLFLLASPETGTPALKPAQRTPEFCAQCHDQTEPLVAMFGLAGYPDEIAAGNPFREWQSNKFSQQGPEYMACIDCHGQRGTGTLHRWPREQAELIRSAYTIDLLRTQATETGWRLGISIMNTGAGHMFPTGDPGHAVTLEAMLMDENNTMLANGRIVFSHIKSSVDGSSYIVDDNRLSPGSLAECWITIDDPGNTMAGTASLVLKYVVRYSYDPAAQAALKVMGVEPESLLVDESTITLPQLTL